MGDPRKPKKKYNTPSHPWQKVRIEEDKIIAKEYGTKNRVEIWKHKTQLKDFRTQIKKLVAVNTPQSKKEIQLLIQKLVRLGILKEGAQTDDVLDLNLRNIMDRRLQTLVFKKGLARSMKQARQFIVHEHIMVNGKKVKSPSHLIRVEEESAIAFANDSKIKDEAHPERIKLTEQNNTEQNKEAKEDKKEKAKEQRRVKREEKKSRPAKKPKSEKKETEKDKIQLSEE